MIFEKDNIQKEFSVVNGRVRTTITIGDKQCFNPTLSLFLEQGWSIVEQEPISIVEQAPILPTRSELVEQYIRSHGYRTYGAELAIINNHAENLTEYAEAYTEYLSVRHAAKEWAETQNYREDELEISE